MVHRIWQLAVLLSCLCYASCNRNLVSYQKNFADEIDVQQNLVFTFDKDLVPDSLTNHWDPRAYIEFTPAVQGSFKWNSASELVFSPSTSFAPGTTYKATLSSLLQKKSKQDVQFSEKSFTFHTAPLRVDAVQVSWNRGAGVNNLVVQADLYFNYEIDLKSAFTKVKLSSLGKALMANTTGEGAGKKLTLQFSPVNDVDADVPLQIAVADKILLSNGQSVMQQDTTINTKIPSRFNLAITEVVAQHSGTEGIVTVKTSQPVKGENLKDCIVIEPATAFTVTESDEGFIISSDKFLARNSYNITIKTTIDGVFGGKLKSDYATQVTFENPKPFIKFANTKGMYLSPEGYRNVALTVVNVPKVVLTVVKVYENNLESFFRAGKSRDYNYDDANDSYDEYEYYNTANLGDQVYTETIETAKLPKVNAASVLHIDFRDKLKAYDGVYVICVRSADHQFIQDSKILSLSDIGLIVKADRENMYVFANSIRNATPLQGCKVRFVSNTNQQVYTATTNSDGVAVLDGIANKTQGMRIDMVTAKMKDDFNFILLNQSAVETSRFDVGGRSANETGLNAMVYGERNLYRPGETIHVSTIVRTEQWAPTADVPVKMKLVMPNGKEFATQRKTLNAQGSAEASYKMPPTATTGIYQLEVYTGNDVLLTSYPISVEDFMPDRMKVQLKADRTEYRTGQQIVATIQADNLFGTPAAGRKYECITAATKIDFTAKGYEAYSFGLKKDVSVNFNIATGETDARGAATVTNTIPTDINFNGLYRANVATAMFDETGRPVRRYTTALIYTQPVFLGMKQTEEYVDAGKPIKVQIIALDAKGNPQNNVRATVTFIRRNWHTYIEQSGSSYRFVSKSDEHVELQKEITISGAAFSYALTPRIDGEYEVRLALSGSTNYVAQTYYAYGSGGNNGSFEVNNEGNVTIKTDKDKYAAGENINVLFTTPFEGRMLVTVERNKVMKHLFVDTKNKAASLSLKAEDDCVPNVYVSATLFRPMGDNGMVLTVAHGIKPVYVEKKALKLPVEITMPEQARSKTKQTIVVKTTPGAYVTIAAVDEGILQVNDFETPDPYAYFYQKVALGAASYDIYPMLLPELNTMRFSSGGDGSDDSKMRANPLFVNRVKNVSFWSGIMQAGSDGRVKYEVDVPQFSGDLRVMAAVYKDKSFGSAEKHTKIADPLIISAALPRFLSPGDEAIMGVTISNTTRNSANVTISAATVGALSMMNYQPQTIAIKANSEQRVEFRVIAPPTIGTGKVTVTASGLNETFTNETELSVRPTASLQKRYYAGQVADGSIADINLTNDFMLGTMKGQLTIANSPLVQFSANLRELIQYPYGCVEQTVSAAFPQLYYQDLVKSIAGQDSRDMNPASNVQNAIYKLQSMQTHDGGVAYWPGMEQAHWWGSVYATHFLLEARKAGYEVNSVTLERLIQYLRVKLNKHETETLYYNNGQKKTIAAKAIAYSLYVLAIAGNADQPNMNYYKANMNTLSTDSKYLLAAAFGVAGQPDKAKQVMPAAFGDERSDESLGGSFYSYTRDLAISLFASIEIDPNSQQTGTLIRMLSEQVLKSRNSGYHMNTQENAFCYLAMGKVARKANNTKATAEVIANGRSVATSSGAATTVDLRAYQGSKVQVRPKGGPFYYFSELSGISASGTVKQEDSYLKIRRTYYSRSGSPISGNSFKQNDLVVVALTLTSEHGDVDNVAITDMLPACFEIENARLYSLPAMDWIKDEERPDYLDIRDDRINLFTSASAKTKKFYYMVRVVSPGTFKVGPAQADAMYSWAYHSYNGGGTITVTP